MKKKIVPVSMKHEELGDDDSGLTSLLIS